jgi:hypothetical protein
MRRKVLGGEWQAKGSDLFWIVILLVGFHDFLRGFSPAGDRPTDT